MGLTVEHLAPYLPYELTGVWIPPGKKTGKVWRMANLSSGNSIFMIRSTKTTVRADARPLNEFKPLLIPLSALTVADCGSYGYNDIESFVGYIKSGHMDHRIWLDMVKAHYDVFGLIEQGLAIDKTTFKI
jgi:hypothetical protein